MSPQRAGPVYGNKSIGILKATLIVGRGKNTKGDGKIDRDSQREKERGSEGGRGVIRERCLQVRRIGTAWQREKKREVTEFFFFFFSMWKFAVIEDLPLTTIDKFWTSFNSVSVQYSHVAFTLKESSVTVIISPVCTGCEPSTSWPDCGVRGGGQNPHYSLCVKTHCRATHQVGICQVGVTFTMKWL